MDSRRYRAGAALKPAWFDHRAWLPHPCIAPRHANGTQYRTGGCFPGTELRPRPRALYRAGESGSTYPCPGGARVRRPSGQGTSVAQNSKYGRDRRGNQAGLDRRDARALVDGELITEAGSLASRAALQRLVQGNAIMRWCIIPFVFPEGKEKEGDLTCQHR